MKKPATLVMLLAMCATCSQGGEAPSDPLISLGSHALQIHREGKGTPVVIIDAGISDSLDKLLPLQAHLAKETQVVTYNRAGYGRSEAGPLPRDCGREAEELRALLKKASVPGPYVLVGHSLGALNMQVFASQHPGEVAGLVLLDPPPLSFILGKDYPGLRAMADGMTEEWQGIADSSAKSRDDRDKVKSIFFQMIASEHREMFGRSAKLAGGISSFGDLPLAVMAAGKPNPAFGEGAEAYQKYWIGQSRSLAEKSTKSKFILAEKASHYLYLDAPDLVAESILSLVREIRAKEK